MILKQRMKAAMGTAATVAAAASVMLTATPADACGGFFCNNQPVDQTGENILFVQQGDEIEAHVNIFYQGEAEDFAWIVPTPSRPEVGISTADLFTRLNQRVGVRFELEYRSNGDCYFNAFPDDDDAFDDSEPSAPEDNGGGVTVVEQSSVGPFDFAVLQATSSEALLSWLQDNSYDIPDDVGPFIEPYLIQDSQMHFVAFRLQNNRDVGDIAPVTLRYNSSAPMIPIQLTAIATQPDMGVRAHILAQERAVPENYLHVQINEARVNWFGNGNNYNQLVTDAMNEAGGQGFVTEYAGDTEPMRESLYREGQYDTAALAEIEDPLEFMAELQSQGFVGTPQLMAMLERYIPVPEGVDARSFYNCLECFADQIDRQSFDSVAFANELEASIVEPLRHAQELFDTTPYLTRLFTTLSAEEMTRDPGFAYNADMPTVSNIHKAIADFECEGQDFGQGTYTLTLEDGRTINGDLSDAIGGRLNDDADAPAAAVIEQTNGAGGPEVVRDIKTGEDRLDEVLEERNNPRVLPTGGDLESGVGCSTVPGGTGTASTVLLLLLVGAGLRRRRQQ